MELQHLQLKQGTFFSLQYKRTKHKFVIKPKPYL